MINLQTYFSLVPKIIQNNNKSMKNTQLLLSSLLLMILLLGNNVIPIAKAQACEGQVPDEDVLEIVRFFESLYAEDWELVRSTYYTQSIDKWEGLTFDEDCRIETIRLAYVEHVKGTVTNVNLPTLKELYIQGATEMTGKTLPDFSTYTNLMELVIESCALTGNLPDLNIPSLRSLFLSDNQFSGTIPEWKNLPQLEVLVLEANLLEGELPDFQNFPSLQQLSLNGNKLTGQVPDFDLPNLAYIYLSHNELSGGLPFFSKLEELILFKANHNQFKGWVPNYSNPNLRNLDLSHNQFVGYIPGFEALTSMQKINLSNNEIIGGIPDFSALTELNELDVSNNLLTDITIHDFFYTIRKLVICPGNRFEDLEATFRDTGLTDKIDINCTREGLPTISGRVFFDRNKDCLPNEGDFPIPKAIVSINEGWYYAFTDEKGFYEFSVPEGVYTIRYVRPNELWDQTCPIEGAGYQIVVDSPSFKDTTAHFANQAVKDCALLTVDLHTPLMRRCFENTFTIDYCNSGTVPASDALIRLTIPETLEPLAASHPYEVKGNYVNFELGDLFIGACGKVTFTTKVACDAVLGETVCVEAQILPSDDCKAANLTWDKSDLEVYAACDDDALVSFTIKNVGDDMDGSSDYRVYEDDILSSLDMFRLAAEDSMIVNFPANGNTYRMVVEQRPGHPSSPIVQKVVELCGEQPFSLGHVQTRPLWDLDTYYKVACDEVIGSYDPNDLKVVPFGLGEGNFIGDSTVLEYLVRFQNIGNDTAFTVIITDTLAAEKLDISSIKGGASSHPYRMEIVDYNVLKLTFPDIHLTAKEADEARSQGFVKFQIAQVEGNAPGTVIRNTAHIFFDFNEPITTNTTVNTIWEEPALLNVYTDPVSEVNSPKVFVDGARGIMQVEMETMHFNEPLYLQLYDVTGRVLLQETINTPNQTFPIVHWSDGLLVYRIINATNHQLLTSGKILLKR